MHLTPYFYGVSHDCDLQIQVSSISDGLPKRILKENRESKGDYTIWKPNTSNPNIVSYGMGEISVPSNMSPK